MDAVDLHEHCQWPELIELISISLCFDNEYCRLYEESVEKVREMDFIPNPSPPPHSWYFRYSKVYTIAPYTATYNRSLSSCRRSLQYLSKFLEFIREPTDIELTTFTRR